ncbi:MAG: hypothetical protein JWP44_5046 [Mucilaginibacter sp.]|nr:hypothetical protein [Mucilaginibacter sp.]
MTNNYTTVLFKDRDNNFYLGIKEDSKIVGFKLLPNWIIDEVSVDIELHEFLIVNVTPNSMTTITQGSLTVTDGEEELTTPLCDLTREKLLETFNTLIPEKYLKDSNDV